MELTKYEVARLIGARALQLSMGAPPLVKVDDERETFIRIAEVEMARSIIPLSVMKSSKKIAQ